MTPTLTLYDDWHISRQSNMVVIKINGEPHFFTPDQARDYARGVYLDACELADNLLDQAEEMRTRILSAAI